jgi:hypothetical protein
MSGEAGSARTIANAEMTRSAKARDLLSDLVLEKFAKEDKPMPLLRTRLPNKCFLPCGNRIIPRV